MLSDIRNSVLSVKPANDNRECNADHLGEIPSVSHRTILKLNQNNVTHDYSERIYAAAINSFANYKT